MKLVRNKSENDTQAGDHGRQLSQFSSTFVVIDRFSFLSVLALAHYTVYPAIQARLASINTGRGLAFDFPLSAA